MSLLDADGESMSHTSTDWWCARPGLIRLQHIDWLCVCPARPGQATYHIGIVIDMSCIRNTR